MEHIIAFIKAFEISNKSAIMALLFGSIALVLIYNNLWPLASGEIVTAPLAGTAALLGAVVVIVNMGYWLVAIVRGRSAAKAAILAQVDRDALEAREIQTNLDTLNDLEKAQLVWILRNDSKRVDQLVEGSLIRKKILVRVDRSHTLVDVADTVWSERADLLEKWRRTMTTPSFPHRRF